MRVTISSGGGTFRTVSLAMELAKKGFLQNLYIPFVRGKQELPANVLVQNNRLFFAKLFMDRSGLARLSRFGLRHWYCEQQDRFVAKKLFPGSNAVFVESVMALHTMRKAKGLGMITVVDRTNSHIEFQSDLLNEENQMFGIKQPYNSQAVVEKSLKEYEEADYISVLSSFVRKSFLKKGVGERKLLLIPSGIEMNMFRKVQKKDDVFRVLFCGGLCLKKGIYYLLKAFHELKLKNAELLLVGPVFSDVDGILKKYKDVFKHIARVPRRQMSYYYSQSSVFVLPSLEEGLAKVMIEAMACDLPVIATTNTGAEDVVTEGIDGFVIRIRDSEAIKEKILFLYENEARRVEMGRKAALAVRDRFSTQAYTDRFVSALNQVSMNQ